MSKTFRGPSGPQAFVLAVTAIGLLVTGCFGVFGFGVAMGPASQNSFDPVVISLAGLYVFGLLAAVVACIVAIVRSVRHGPLYNETNTARPTFAQGFLIVLAAIVLFSGTCFTVAASNPRPRGGIGLITGLLVMITVLASLGGFALMWGRAMSSRRTTHAAPPESQPPSDPGA